MSKAAQELIQKLKLHQKKDNLNPECNILMKYLKTQLDVSNCSDQFIPPDNDNSSDQNDVIDIIAQASEYPSEIIS